MKTNKLLTIALLWTLVINWISFADNTVWTNNQNIINYRNQITTLRTELKSATTHDEKYNIRNKMYKLSKQISTQYPRFTPWYIHKDFHFNERNLLSWFRMETKNQKQEFKNWIKTKLKAMWENRKQIIKPLKKSLDKKTKQEIKQINKEIHNQIKEIKNQIQILKEQKSKTNDKKTKQEIRNQIKWLWNQIRNIKINKLEKIKELIPEEQKEKIQAIIDNMKKTYNDITSKRKTFKNTITTNKTKIYNWISETLKNNIDTAIEQLKNKLNTLTKEKQSKLLLSIQKKINRIIQNHLNETKINHNGIHFKTELWILTYLKEKIDNIVNELK